jgi:hypothetical protein
METLTLSPQGEKQKTFLEWKWIHAFLQVMPLFVGIHILFFLISLFANLYLLQDFSAEQFPLSSILEGWNHWDAGHYLFIAENGYDGAWRTAFFPLYPLLMHGVMYVIPNAIVSGLIISNLANLGVMVVFYQLMLEQYGHEQAKRAVFYISLFPTAFFLSSIYNVSLSLFLTLCFFYQVRHQRWWFAGLFGLVAALNRSSGSFLLFPMLWEYTRQSEALTDLRQKRFPRRFFRFALGSFLLIPIGLGIFAAYCQWRFGDWLAFSHAQSVWQHENRFPLITILVTIKGVLRMGNGLDVYNLHNLMDLLPVLFIGLLLILSFVGPWRFKKEHLAYGVYAALLYLFFLTVPVIMGGAPVPLQSIPRYCLELFPAFMVLSQIGEKQSIHQWYLVGASILLTIWLTLFLTGHWII